MSREIKFRVWDKKKMWEVTSILWVNGKFFEFGLGDGETAVGEFDTNQMILMQFTGLKDRNGKEIFEGDVIKTAEDDAAEIIFRNGSFGVEVLRSFSMGENGEESDLQFIPLSDENLGMGFKETKDIPEMYYAIEVIGNVHENPELVKP